MLKTLITCEHGGNEIPPAHAGLFTDARELLQSHRGYDIGAQELLENLTDLADKTFYATTSRLLVELNRSLHHRNLFSEITRKLPQPEQEKILKEHYHPYRERVEELIHDLVMVGHQVLHVSVHSFTPVLDGEERQADIGLLYDPKRVGERNFCRDWKEAFREQQPELVVRFNYPYLGVSDGFPTYLRRKFTDRQYIGIELEVNQKFPLEGGEKWKQLQRSVKQSLKLVQAKYKTNGDND
ncbi:N-formylglutamate amidohydrolase [Pontibacter chinhatensis]|uniref:Predicted N-formylglutamate amidohydrolase n=1 Tax=Pontibacter chinhatensis TaxID=1436961 RepID=A0A1I2MHU1_9BACT|nr:N-formylglutamate amidohydrolase [Pontibacter chinhatensis]SFF89087.1 Predicted N-formylglutamate amidohydrolase [Pontibacter chinhatensis]